MPRKTFDRLADDKKERVMRSAIGEFLSQGFEKAKVETIAAKAHVAKGSIYQYFEDKKDLFLYAVTWSIEYFIKNIDRQTPLQDMDVFDYFLSGRRERFELLRREPVLMAFSIAVTTGRYDSLTADINRELKRLADEYERKLITNGKRRGTIRSDLDDEALLLFFQGVTEKFEMMIMETAISNNFEFTEEQFADLEAAVDKMIALLRNGMEGNRHGDRFGTGISA